MIGVSTRVLGSSSVGSSVGSSFRNSEIVAIPVPKVADAESSKFGSVWAFWISARRRVSLMRSSLRALICASVGWFMEVCSDIGVFLGVGEIRLVEVVDVFEVVSFFAAEEGMVKTVMDVVFWCEAEVSWCLWASEAFVSGS